MEKQNSTVKYEVVIGINTDGSMINGRRVSPYEECNSRWISEANKVYEETGVYVSAISIDGFALYNKDWGCPSYGEYVVVFNCTPNTIEFIKDLDLYEECLMRIVRKLKEIYDQSTITITKIPSNIIYMSGENEN